MKLYKFLSEKIFLDHLDNILRGLVYVADWKSFNDPMEGFFSYFLSDSSSSDMVVGEKAKYRVSCFTRDYRNYLMWSHYANKHQGVCLESEVKPNALSDRYIVERINYSKTLPNLLNTNSSDEQAKTFLLTKIRPWKYEKEVRLLYKTNCNESIPFGKLKSITLGIKSDNFIDSYRIASQISEVSVDLKIYKAKIDYDNTKIEREHFQAEI